MIKRSFDFQFSEPWQCVYNCSWSATRQQFDSSGWTPTQTWRMALAEMVRKTLGYWISIEIYMNSKAFLRSLTGFAAENNSFQSLLTMTRLICCSIAPRRLSWSRSGLSLFFPTVLPHFLSPPWTFPTLCETQNCLMWILLWNFTDLCPSIQAWATMSMYQQYRHEYLL